MQIDWITVSAQVVNFLILVWLLKRFLYRPIVDAMARREARIADQLNEARAREGKAEEAAARYEAQQAALDRDRAGLMAAAKDEVEQQRRQMLDEARAKAAEMRVDWQRQVRQEKAEFLRGLRRQTAEAVGALARETLREVADVELEERVVVRFLDRLRRLEPATRRALAETGEPVRIATGFPLEATTKSHLTRAVHEELGAGLAVEYVERPELVCGIELTSAGRQLRWHLAGQLDELAERMRDAVDGASPVGEGG